MYLIHQELLQYTNDFLLKNIFISNLLLFS